LRITPNFGLSFIPAVMLAQASMGFLRLGGAYGYFAEANTWRWGMIMGLGLETAFTPCWSVRAEYDYTVFRSMPVGTPRSDEFVVALKYTFDA
jgi:opacity protein-like surface antigen